MIQPQKFFLLSSKLYLSNNIYYSKIPVKGKERPIIALAPALLGDECHGKNLNQVLFDRIRTNFDKKSIDIRGA